ncbi:nuclear transport factor 2 family protein [Actinokineospora diospyrosa]|uniref:SnoaL-like domain-containing protein n=1 Tax=Actinokineospora diospyrosa TaxID=103728 RepID=A0ABT1IDX6_9PSEU|nr:nuclear transport factor 2 family protein [Actinokineospora diospyrosa]MCP2270823.1 SnoaL-like domain-containing protein [Actinokineospora diospyrosa]
MLHSGRQAAPAESRLAALLDREEISGLVDRYVVGLDTAQDPAQDIEWYRRIFTEDVRLSFPIGERRGLDGLAEFQRRARLTWQSTLHVSANHVVDLDGDRAAVRVQILGTHVEYGVPTAGLEHATRFDMGGYYDVTAVRGPDGWRIDDLSFTVVWTSGAGRPNADYSAAG